MRKAPLLLALALTFATARAELPPSQIVPIADGFDYPVGPPDAAGYYKSRGFRANSHLGDDWNGGPGDSDIGLPVYNIGHGIVVIARNVKLGWGNTVMVRHAYYEGGTLAYIDSMHAHLDRITVAEGQRIRRGQQVGTIGTGGGMYPAHLHFEIRKNISIGLFRSQYPRDTRAYWDPTLFIQSRRRLGTGSGKTVIALNTFKEPDGPATVAPSSDPSQKSTRNGESRQDSGPRTRVIVRPGTFKVQRYDGF